MGQGVEDRQLHGGEAQLGKDTAIPKLGEGMHHALRMHHHFQRVIWQAKQVVSFDQLQRFVRQSGTVDCDLVAHAPGRMPQGLLDRGMLDSFGAPLPEGPAATR